MITAYFDKIASAVFDEAFPHIWSVYSRGNSVRNVLDRSTVNSKEDIDFERALNAAYQRQIMQQLYETQNTAAHQLATGMLHEVNNA